MDKDEIMRTTLHEAVLELFKVGGFGKPALIMAFTLPPDYQELHWITNVTRKQGIEIMRETANKMEAQQN